MSDNVPGWTVLQHRFMQWLTLPTVERVPHTQEALANELGVNDRTLTRWRQLPGFMEEVQRMILASLGDVSHDVVHSFKSEARKGSYSHQKTYFEMMGWHTEKNHHEGELTIRVIHVKPDSQQPDD